VKALILGGGSTVWTDLQALEALLGAPWDGIVIGVNDIICHWPRRLDYLVSLHPEHFQKWMNERATKGYPGDYETWTSRRSPYARRYTRSWGGGSSGMLAVTVADALKCSHAVLCGVPMTKTPHFAESTVHNPTKSWPTADGHFRAWQANVKRMQGWVKSMSGRTRDLLGEPTLEWLCRP
jgi:hypothetical protein